MLRGASVLFTIGCAADAEDLGRTFAVMPSGYHDIDEENESGWGGENFVRLLEEDGLMDIPSLFPNGRVHK